MKRIESHIFYRWEINWNSHSIPWSDRIGKKMIWLNERAEKMQKERQLAGF